MSDVRLEFKLAKVTRTKTTKNSFTYDDAVKKSSTGGIAPFDPKTHLNLWVCAHSVAACSVMRNSLEDRRPPMAW